VALIGEGDRFVDVKISEGVGLKSGSVEESGSLLSV
jgi:hypothetical protein